MPLFYSLHCNSPVIDRDGTIDMMFTTCKSVDSEGIGSDCFINIIYNQQLGLCSSSTESEVKNDVRVCRQPNNLCTPDDHFKFDLQDSPDNDVCELDPLYDPLMLLQAFSHFAISSLLPENSSLLVTDTTYDPSIPLSIRLGDANLDGFLDFLVISASGDDRTPYLVYSTPCAPGVVGCNPSDGSGRRGWRVADIGTISLKNVKDARGVTFLDMDEDVSYFSRPFFPDFNWGANALQSRGL